MEATIVKIISNSYTLRHNNEEYVCSALGKFRNMKITPLVGDRCIIDIQKKVIQEILPRNNYLDRPAVANIDNALIVTSLKEPDLSLNLLDKFLSSIILKNIRPIIIFTKLDLLNSLEKKEYKKIKKYYQKIGISVYENTNIKKIKKQLSNSITVLTGQSGAGKSSLLNKFDASLNLQTAPISQALGRGKHTTRHTELFLINDFYVVDTPGFSAFELSNYTNEQIRDSFIEFVKYPCKFKDCLHQKKQNCNVFKAVEDNKILKSRYDNYLKFISKR